MPRRFHSPKPGPETFERLSPVFINRWHALFAKLLLRTDELQATAWAEEHPDATPTTNPQEVRVIYRQSRKNPAVKAAVRLLVPMDNEELRLSSFRGMGRIDSTHTAIGAPLGQAAIFKEERNWAELAKSRRLELATIAGYPEDLTSYHFSRVTYYSDEAGGYRQAFTPLTGTTAQLVESFERSRLFASERAILEQQGPYALALDQVLSTLTLMSALAGENPPQPFEDSGMSLD